MVFRLPKPLRVSLFLLLSLVTLILTLSTAWNPVFGQSTSTEARLTAYLQQLRNNPTITGDGQISGTAGNDRIVGSANGDFIFGDLGNSSSSGGNDLIYALAGVDTVKAGPGNDILFGSDGDMNGSFSTSPGLACTFAPECDDKLWGEDGNDWLVGESGNDVLIGGQPLGAPNSSAYTNDVDVLLGGDDDDKLIGGYGDDTLIGGRGHDRIIGGSESTQQADHAADGIDILFGDEENSSNPPGADLFVLGANGVRYYDDNLTFSNGFVSRAMIKDFNPTTGDRIQLAKLPPQPSIGSVARYFTSTASNWTLGFSGTAIYYTSGVSGHQPELIAIVENFFNLNLDNPGQVIYN